MKICLLNVIHAPDDKRVFQKIARSLLQAGHELTWIGPRLPSPGGSTAGRADNVGAITYLEIPEANSKKQRLRSVWRLVRIGRHVPADAYYAPEPESWVAALLLKALTRRKVVFDMHEHVPSEFSKFFPRPAQPLMEWLTARFMRLFARLSDYIILTRESFEPLFLDLRVPRTVVINTNHLKPQETSIPAELQARYGGRPVIIHQGIFGDVRGSYQLLEAMKLLVPQVPDICCILLGRYEFGSEAAYRRAISAASLEEHMHLHGVVSYESVPGYIALAQVGLILFQPGPLNHTLAMPHKLFDYMREGVPAVAPAFAVEVARIMNEAQCGLLVDVTQPREIAHGIAQLLLNPDEARRLGSNGRRLVETKYHWEAEERRLLEAFASLETRS